MCESLIITPKATQPIDFGFVAFFNAFTFFNKNFKLLKKISIIMFFLLKTNEKHITLLAAVLLTATTYAQIGINNENPDASAALDITSTTGGLLVPRMTAAQRDAITATQGLIIFCTDCASGEGELQIKLTSSWKNTIGGDVNDPPAIGDTYQGGIVFYLDGNGGGLIAADSDQSSAQWGCYEQSIGGTSSAVGTGAANTTAIVSGCSETAYSCKNLCRFNIGRIYRLVFTLKR